MEVTSEQESEFSNLDSMSPQSRESDNSSPSQQVPHLAQVFAGMPMGREEPFLRIVEQPTHDFRFRYKSEMVGMHGCILGSNSGPKCKTHPTVELVNWMAEAVIRVRLAQADCDEEHPHKLLEDEQEDRDVAAHVPLRDSYRVAFPGMSIIHTAKKDVPGLLFAKLMKSTQNPDIKILRAHCETAAKGINLNKVRLMFSAHDVHTNHEICEPVFSDVIHNMKSASTNELKIVRMSKVIGRAGGGDDVYLLVEKVNKKNIKVRFYEMLDGEEVWSASGIFTQADVHHQYAIVVRTPPYRDPEIASDVEVFIELVRPTDGRTSEPKKFKYRADQMSKLKKRRYNSSLSSIGSVSGGSVNSLNNIPISVRMMEQYSAADTNVPMLHAMPPMQPELMTSDDALAEALLSGAGGGAGVAEAEAALSRMLDTPTVAEPQLKELAINSSEFQMLLNQDPSMQYRDTKQVAQEEINEYLKVFSNSINDRQSGSIGMDFMRSMELVTDSGKPKEEKEETVSPNVPDKNLSVKHIIDKLKTAEYSAHYKAEEGQEVKQLVKEICEIIKNKEGFDKQAVCSKLERLMDIRLSNGDTFLHMTLASNQPSFEYIIKLIHSTGLTHLLNLCNTMQQSILHLAVIRGLHRAVPTLVTRGCDPVAADEEGNSPLHYAAITRSCLEPLLSAARLLPRPPNIGVYNNDQQTPLHVAALYDAADSARLLLAAGASYTCRDREGRTPLHLAVYDDHYDVAKALLEFIPASCIDTADDRGNSALQIVCGLSTLRKNTLRIVQLLLDNRADPLKQNGPTPSAWEIARHTAVRVALRKRVPSNQSSPEDMTSEQLSSEQEPNGLDGAESETEVKSEPEDYESADDGEQNCGLPLLPLFAGKVSTLLATGGWRLLARRLRGEGLEQACEGAADPAAALLAHIQESDDGLTSKALVKLLREIGENEAADIVRHYIV